MNKIIEDHSRDTFIQNCQGYGGLCAQGMPAESDSIGIDVVECLDSLQSLVFFKGGQSHKTPPHVEQVPAKFIPRSSTQYLAGLSQR